MKKLNESQLNILLDRNPWTPNDISIMYPELYKEIEEEVKKWKSEENNNCPIFSKRISEVVWLDAMKTLYDKEIKEIEKRKYYKFILIQIEKQLVNTSKGWKTTVKDLIINNSKSSIVSYMLQLDLLEYKWSMECSEYLTEITRLFSSIKNKRMNWSKTYEEFLACINNTIDPK